MKALTGRVLATVTAVTVLSACGSALAAEAAAPVAPAAPAISVQLDGKDLTFTDAMPQAKDGRTFLPFRTVFEAMGAQVGYDAAANQVSATRGGTKVVMTLGATSAAVTEDGVDSTLTMDVAPYAADNRTYVPVRFAAQAFGCAVGWDQDDQTAVIVDTEKLVDSTLAQYKYTYLDKFQAYNEQFQAGVWDVDAAFDGSFAMMGIAPLTFEGALDATMADSSKIAADMTMKMDMQAFLDDLNEQSQQPDDLKSEERALLDAMKKDGIELEMRGDLMGDALYMSMSGAALESQDMPADAWYAFDLSAMGIDFADLLNASETMNLNALLQSAMAGMDFNDKDAAYATASTAVDQIARFLSDGSFVKDGDNYTTTYVLGMGSDYMNLSVTLGMEKDKVVGYNMVMETQIAMDDGAATTISIATGMDKKNHMTTGLKMSMPELLEMSMDLTGEYVKGDKAPETEPPADAVVIPYEQLMSGTLGV